MKMALVLISVVMLILLTRPSEAKDVYLALVSDGVTTGVQDWDSLDAVIQSNIHDIDSYFQKGNVTLQPDQELIIRGGSGSIARELDRHKTSKVFFNNGGNSLLVLEAYGCYVKHRLRENTRYVWLRIDSLPAKKKLCGGDDKLLLFNGWAIDLKSLSAKVKAMKETR